MPTYMKKQYALIKIIFSNFDIYLILIYEFYFITGFYFEFLEFCFWINYELNFILKFCANYLNM